MTLNYPQYLEDLRKAYVGRVVTITGWHGQAGRTGRVTAIVEELTCERVHIDLFGPREPHTCTVGRLDMIRLEPIPG